MGTQALTSRWFSVEGQTVLITGGAGGIGRMLTRAFLDAGARVYITGRKRTGLDEARQALGDPPQLRLLLGDLSTPQGARAIVDEFLAAEPALNVLINNAGRTWGASLETFPDSGWQNVMAVNVQSPFVLVQGLLAALGAAATADNPSRVINVGSVYAETTEVMQAYSYTASKAALHQLTRVLARELAPRHILVNAIAPGLFPSHMTEFVLNDAEQRAAVLAGIPRGRPGTIEDIGGLAIFLASRAAAYVTGAIIPLDGGLLVA